MSARGELHPRNISFGDGRLSFQRRRQDLSNVGLRHPPHRRRHRPPTVLMSPRRRLGHAYGANTDRGISDRAAANPGKSLILTIAPAARRGLHPQIPTFLFAAMWEGTALLDAKQRRRQDGL